MSPTTPLRFAASREAGDADGRFSTWTDAYRRLKALQAQLKVAGSAATSQMRSERDRLQRTAEQALKALTAHGGAATLANGLDQPRARGDSA